MPIINVLIFRGTGGVFNVSHPYHNEPPLVRAGHVGVAGVIEDKIIGFHPTPEAAREAGGEKELLEALGQKRPQPGRLQVDDAYFERAHELREQTKGRTTVYMYEVEISDETLQQIRSWYNERKEAMYNFPHEDGQFNQGESNCAMFWQRFDIQLPVQTGSIKAIIRTMKLKGYSTWSND